MTDQEKFYREEIEGQKQRKMTPRLVKATLSAQVVIGILLTASGWLIVDYATSVKTDIKDLKMTMVNEQISVAYFSSQMAEKINDQDRRLVKLEDRPWSRQ